MSPSTGSEEVVIVGAGIIGIACAHYLHQAGWRVTVIDRGTIAGECSQGNCGYICPSHVLPLTEPGAVGAAFQSLFRPRDPFKVQFRLSPAFWNWMWQFARRCHHSQMLAAGAHLKALLDSSRQEYQRLMQTEQLDCGWTENGLLYVLQSQRGWQKFAETDRLLTDHFGIAARRIAGPDLPTLDPALRSGLAGGFLYEQDASLRPDRLNAAWVARLKEHGVRFVEHCELLGVTHREQSREQSPAQSVVQIQTSQGDLPVTKLVVATGAWSVRLSQMLGCRIPIEPGKGYSVTMNRPAICPKFPMLFPEHRVGVSPFADGYRLGSMMEFVGFNSEIPEWRIQQLRDSAAPYLTDPVGHGPQETWFGWRPMTWDSLPIIGRIPRLANAYLATGHNMLGMSLATATGKLIRELMLDQTPHVDPTPFSPSRF